MCGLFGYHGNKLSTSDLNKAFSLLAHRGPDDTKTVTLDNAFLGFHRLAIMDLTHNGDQPFTALNQKKYLMCNGEVYNYKNLLKDFKSYDFHSTSDCEVILPMILEYGIEQTCVKLDSEFAFVYYDAELDKMYAARDPIGIRPLFYGRSEHGEIMFASEAKVITTLCETVLPFPPGHFFDGESMVSFRSMTSQAQDTELKLDDALRGIKQTLEAGVLKRLVSDAPLGFLLSGGLDSSLVCAIAAKNSNQPIKTFSVGSEHDAIDNKYAEEVARFIGADHTTVTFSRSQVFNALDEIIRMLETWDITTIRASVGMYLVCQYIRENTSVKVLLTGEVSDELFGYKYTDFAPNAAEFQKESQKRIEEIYLYDVLRADRCISAHSIEARVPFGDLDFVDYVMSIPAALKMNQYGHGKYLLRKAFEGEGYLPESILYREKAAFSDAVGHSVVDDIKAFADESIDDVTLSQAKMKYPHGTPLTKEALFYRQVFEKHYPGHESLIPGFWLPNSSWENCDVIDPSARALPNYGKSGS